MSDRKVGQVAKLLIDARKLVETPECWAKGTYMDRSRKQFCVVGAVSMVASRGMPALWSSDSYWMLQARSFLQDACGDVDIEGWNDNPDTGHADVLLVFDKAISMALARGI